MAEEIGASLRVTEHAAGTRAGCGIFDVRSCGGFCRAVIASVFPRSSRWGNTSERPGGVMERSAGTKSTKRAFMSTANGPSEPAAIAGPSAPEITWSLMHPTPLDADYFRRVLDEARRYRVDSFELCGECHNENGGLDGLISYEGYAGASEPRRPESMVRNAAVLGEIVARAHAASKSVLYWHREVMVPKAVAEKVPGLLDADGEFDLLGRAYEDLLRYKIDRALAAVPDLDGVVLTLTESDYSVIHNSRPDRYPPSEVVAQLVRIFAGELQARGKRFVLRSFGSIAQDYDDILAGARLAARDFSFEIETKVTPYDFIPFLPVNPWLRRVPGTTLGLEGDCVGEFLGAGNLPAANVDNIVRYVRAGQAAGVDRYVIRLDRLGNAIFDTSYEINLQAYHAAIDDPSVMAEALQEQYASAHGPAAHDSLRRLVEAGMEAVGGINFIGGNVIFHTYPLDSSLKWIKAGGIFALFHQGGSLANQSEIWSILAAQTAPTDRGMIVTEKEDAARLAAEMRQRVASLEGKIPTELHAHLTREWGNAAELATLYGAFCRVVCAYFAGIESGDAEGRRLDEALSSVRPLFAAWLSAGELAKPLGHAADETAYHGIFEGHGRDFKSNYVRPLWAILCELRQEYDVETAMRRRAADQGVTDLLIFGAATDEWRLSRSMHASHARCADGLLSRQVGNSVFPNGSLEFRLARPAGGGSLVIEGRPGCPASVQVKVDDESPRVFDLANDPARIALPAGGRQEVRVRLSKSGPHYPEVCTAAVVAR